MRAVGNFRGTHMLGPALTAGLIVLAALCALGGRVFWTWSGDGPHRAGETSVPQPDRGGTTTVAKLDQTPAPSAQAQPQPAEPNLQGLNEIPHELVWNRTAKAENEARPKAFAALSGPREVLPWDAVEPVPFAALPSDSKPAVPDTTSTQDAKAAPPRPPLHLHTNGDVETWVKTKVTEVKGADRARPLYHFEMWLEPPADVKRRLVGVAYDFSTPAIMPQSQASSDQTSGFRISAGGLACADEITLTLRFDDGRSQKVALDGCGLQG